MSVVSDRFGCGRRRVLAVAWLLAAAISPAAAQDGGARTVNLTIDQAQVMRLPDTVGTLVVGNPLIADVSIQSGGMVVLTAKGFGQTNVVALDRSGNVIEEKVIRVHGSRDAVTVYRGTQRESYSCTPSCERRITLGDAPDYFGATLGQSAARNGQAQGAAAASK